MRVGIMQPYFFPYFGHFALIAQCDAWYVFDTSQYKPKSWMNRNRVLHPDGGPNWVGVPLANSSVSIRSHEARILDVESAKRTLLGKLSHYRRRAPHYQVVMDIVEDTFSLPKGDDSLVHLDVRALGAVCRYLDLPFAPTICSEMDLGLPPDLGPGDWAPEIASRVGASAYLNPISGRELFDVETFNRLEIALEFFQPSPYGYATPGFDPVEGLSILDVLMWNDSHSVHCALLESSGIVSLESTRAQARDSLPVPPPPPSQSPRM